MPGGIVARRSWWLALGAAVGTFASVYVIEAVVARFGLRADATLIDDSLLAVVVAALVFSLEQQHQRELRRQQAKLALIAEMNHHVRNALQVIVGSTLNKVDPVAAAKIREAARRIEWALREVLPADELTPGQYTPASRPWVDEAPPQSKPGDGA